MGGETGLNFSRTPMSKLNVTLIDNYDSFTFNLVHYFGAQGARVDVHRNDKVSVADRRGIRVGESRGDACRTQGPRGVLGHPRESLGKFERL